ncbi:MAG: type I methionyl aminopeptidase [Thermoanaerobacterales bacterium]|nr:type I methionyl aminopeptidase [Thermoanaerobacterales bacterium]
MITRKSTRELDYMREAGRIVAGTLRELEKAVRPGITTRELDVIAEDFIRKQGAKPAFKGLYGFPASICASVNEEVVHGIPGLRELQNGDIISIDIGAEINGYFGDGAATFPIGTVNGEVLELLRVTREALHAGIEKARPGNRLTDISHAVQSVAEAYRFGVVRDYVGHGIGRKMHEEPQVPNYGPPGRGPRLEPGMTLAIEPMINLGTHEVETLSDRWTVVTRDRKPSAHFEHTIAITDGPAEILTRC